MDELLGALKIYGTLCAICLIIMIVINIFYKKKQQAKRDANLGAAEIKRHSVQIKTIDDISISEFTRLDEFTTLVAKGEHIFEVSGESNPYNPITRTSKTNTTKPIKLKLIVEANKKYDLKYTEKDGFKFIAKDDK